MATKILVVLADGFEEIEAVVPIDVFRRLELDVTVAGLNGLQVEAAHNMVFNADVEFADCRADQFDVLFLPGGMPGSVNLRDDDRVGAMAQEMDQAGKLVTAICAAPITLGKAGLLNGRKATCYPGFEDQLNCLDYTANMTEVDGNIITGKGPGASFEFAMKVAVALGKSEEIEKMYGRMFVTV